MESPYKTKEVIDTNQIVTINEIIKHMLYQPFSDFDTWYPTIEDIERVGTKDDDGNITYSKEDIAFLIWIEHPLKKELTKSQEKTRFYVQDILYSLGFDESPWDEDDDDEYGEDALREVFKKYGMA